MEWRYNNSFECLSMYLNVWGHWHTSFSQFSNVFLLFNNYYTLLNYNRYPFSDICTGPLFEDNLLFEDSTFPIQYLTEVSVTCQSGYSLVGDQIITCEKDTYYIYKTRPSCGDQCKSVGHRILAHYLVIELLEYIIVLCIYVCHYYFFF